ncbi:F-box protein At5g49610-like [Elaeis guineensis]|uniref:F-box protein At5g49610-like n=1 Tax=Elaeis guineensis var. tenera TaxID=51953 RepID=A0A8N4IHD5_ELAGV|nr:F-box protein At5g49610-like [Elaeis guineensis]
MASMQEGHEDSQSSSPLPEDAVFEILTRASLESLPACRRVCRQWRRLTYDPLFTSLHCNRTQTISGYFLQTLRRNRYYSSFVSIQPLPPSVRPLSLDFLPKDVKIEAVGCRGIVLCTAQEYRGIPRYYVCKPATRQWRWIPNPKTRYLTERIAILAGSTGALEYKIVRFSRPKQKLDHLRCEIFDSQSQAWRRSRDVQLPPGSLRHEAAVSVHGALHWLTYGHGVFAFDVHKESWKLILLPEEVGGDEMRWDCRRLVKCEGQLCLVLVEKEWVEIWVMGDYKEQRWEKRKVVSLEAIREEKLALSIKDIYLPDVAFMDSFFRVIWYDFWRGVLAKVDIDHPFAQEVFKFESDLVSME